MRQRGDRRVGLRDTQRRCAPDLCRSRRRGHRALGADPRASVVRRPSPRDRARRRVAVSDGSHRRRAGQCRRLAARSVRGRTHRRGGVGSRRGRHAQPHGVDGGRVPLARAARLSAQRRPSLLRRRRRGGGQRSRGAVGRRGARRRDPLRLRAHRGRRSPPRRRGPPQHRRDRGREGCCVAPAAGTRHPGPRFDAIRRGQRARQDGQDRVPTRGVPPGAALPRAVARASGVARARRRHDRGAARRVGDRRVARPSAQPGRSALPARMHTRDVLAERGRHEGSAEDERDPRHHRHRRRHPHDAGRAHRRGHGSSTSGAR